MKYLLFLLVSLFTSWVQAQDTTNCGCCDVAHHQFDFWIGTWIVQDSAGTLLGHNTITPVENGCGLRENWTGAKGTTGTSLSFYNQRANTWHQSWVDVNGGVIIMNGQLEGESIVMYTNPIKKADKVIQNKTTWTPLNDGRVHHVWEVTKDGGQTWATVFDGYYSRTESTH